MTLEFDEPKPRFYTPAPKKTGFVYGLIIKLGLAKDVEGAYRIALITIGICITLTACIIIWKTVLNDTFAKDTIPEGVPFLKEIR